MRMRAYSYLQLATVVWTVGGAPIALFIPCFLAFAFDAPGTDSDPEALTFFASVVSFPVVCVVAVGGSWTLYKRGETKAACLLTSLPLVNVIAFTIVVIRTSGTTPPDGYEKVGGKWAYVTHSRRHAKVVRLEVDNETFTILSDCEEDYAKDKSHVFLGSRVIRDADPATFAFVPGTRGHFATDKSRVFVQGYVIPGADPQTFRIIRGVYGRDKRKIYCGNVPMQVANPGDFEVARSDAEVWREYTNPAQFHFHFGEKIDAVVSKESPAVLKAHWGRDGAFYYYGPAQVEGADYASFEIQDFNSAKDKNEVFWGAFPRRLSTERNERILGRE
jgi:hypothetical protein